MVKSHHLRNPVLGNINVYNFMCLVNVCGHFFVLQINTNLEWNIATVQSERLFSVRGYK